MGCSTCQMAWLSLEGCEDTEVRRQGKDNTNKMTLTLHNRCGTTKQSLVESHWKVSRFAPLNRYYILIDEVFFDNFLEIIYLLVVCKNNTNSFILVYFKYLFISCLLLSKLSSETFLAKFTKTTHKNSKKIFFLYQRKSA